MVVIFHSEGSFSLSIPMAQLLIVFIYLVVKLLINNSSSIEGFLLGNLMYFTSGECLRKVQCESISEIRFLNYSMEDVTAIQQYLHYLLPDSPMPGHIQYLVQDSIIIHMYSHKQKLLKLLDRKGIVLNLDATGSLISKPPSCLKKVYCYALTTQHPEFSTSPVPNDK